MSESRVTWATSVPILVFLGLSVLELGPMYATDRRQTKASLNASALWVGSYIPTDQWRARVKTCIVSAESRHFKHAVNPNLCTD